MKYNVGAQSTRGDEPISLQIVMQAGLILLQAARTMPHQQLTKHVYLHGSALRLVLPPRRITLASEIGIDKKIRIPWLEQRRRGDRVVFTEYDAIERRCRANKLGNWGSNLCKLNGPAICEASRWGQRPR